MNLTITAVKGDIVRQIDCDGIVNSANTHLIAGSGVCGAIYAGAGKRLEAYSRPLGPLPVGEALVTPGFDLPFRHIVHVVGPKYFEDPDPRDKLTRTIQNALRTADAVGIQRLALPAISMGVHGYPAAEGIPLLVQSTYQVAESLQHLREVRFVVLSGVLLNLFEDAIDAGRGAAG